MGNCQAVDAAALVIQHPSGKIERLYWPINASEVMNLNPGHYVSLIIPLPESTDEESRNGNAKTVRFTRVKLLRPNETLALGHAYRLITTQEVMKVLKAKKHAKIKEQRSSKLEIVAAEEEEKQPTSGFVEPNNHADTDGTNQELKNIKGHKPRSGSANSATMGRLKSWRPTLKSIAEGGRELISVN